MGNIIRLVRLSGRSRRSRRSRQEGAEIDVRSSRKSKERRWTCMRR